MSAALYLSLAKKTRPREFHPKAFRVHGLWMRFVRFLLHKMVAQAYHTQHQFTHSHGRPDRVESLCGADCRDENAKVWHFKEPEGYEEQIIRRDNSGEREPRVGHQLAALLQSLVDSANVVLRAQVRTN